MRFLRRNASIIILFILFIVLLACQLDYFGMLMGSATPSPSPARVATSTSIPPVTSAPTVVLLPTVPPATPVPQITGAATNNVRVRANPSTSAAILTQLNQGETVLVHGRTAASDWVQITVPSSPGQRGWVASEFIKLSVPMQTLPVVQPGGPGALPTTRPYP